MRDSSLTRRLLSAALATGVGAAALVGAPRVAHAEDVSPDGKGIVGTALLGAEAVVFTEAIIGVRSPLAYGLGAAGGAIAGGLGGYAIEQSVDTGRLPAYLLAGGLALLIPALVVTLDQTRYLPAQGSRDDRPVVTPPSDPGKPGGSAVIGAEPASAPPPAAAPGAPATTPGGTTPAAPSGGSGGGTQQSPVRAPATSLIDFHDSFRVGVPLPQVRPTFTASQKKALGVESNGSEVRFPVVNVTF
ncbi:MAG: hypothetical protein JWP97_6272 [Labilithrix sp.]|nr:hypothetical protein [Labilithrix sp.]